MRHPHPNLLLSLREELRKWYSPDVRGVRQMNRSEIYEPPAHATVHEPWIILDAGILVPVKNTTPTTSGDLHLGESNPWNGGLAEHTEQVVNYILSKMKP